MNDRIFDFTLASPPSEAEFSEMCDFLHAQLQLYTGLQFAIIARHYEPQSWYNLDLRLEGLLPSLLDLALVGVLSYSLRDSLPLIEVTVLPFSHGRRLMRGKQSIIESRYLPTSPPGWEKFSWQSDTYDEWECDELFPCQK